MAINRLGNHTGKKKHNISKVSRFLLKSFFVRRLQKQFFFSHILIFWTYVTVPMSYFELGLPVRKIRIVTFFTPFSKSEAKSTLFLCLASLAAYSWPFSSRDSQRKSLLLNDVLACMLTGTENALETPVGILYCACCLEPRGELPKEVLYGRTPPRDPLLTL